MADAGKRLSVVQMPWNDGAWLRPWLLGEASEFMRPVPRRVVRGQGPWWDTREPEAALVGDECGCPSCR